MTMAVSSYPRRRRHPNPNHPRHHRHHHHYYHQAAGWQVNFTSIIKPHLHYYRHNHH